MSRKFLNSLIIILTAGVIAISPIVVLASPTRAEVETPAIPESPESPETPDLPGEEPVVEPQPDPIPTNTELQVTLQPTEAEIEAAEEAAWEAEREIRRAARRAAREAALAVAAAQAQLTESTTSEPYTEAPQISLASIGGSEGNGEVSLADLSASNSNTGSDSDNTATSTTNNDFDFTANNDLDANNNAYVDVDTGYNSADKNTGDGEVVTGDADIVLTALNVGNNTGVGTQVFNVYDDQTGDLILNFDNVSAVPLGNVCSGGESSNDTTGEWSSNDAATVCTSQNTILVDNNGNIVNDYYLSADAGHNSADKNTGDGSVTTGDANIVLNVINFINNTFLGGGGELLLGLVNIFGSLNGNIVLNVPDSGDDYYLGGGGQAGNSTTGSWSDNNASTNTNNNADISMTNSSDILNNLMLFGDTGSNDASKNTGSGSVTTGNVNSNLNVANISNMNGIGDGGTLWMVLVNNLGSWSGQIWGLDSTGTASPFFTFEIGEDGAFNAVTGADSTNNAAVENNNNTDITMNNNANLTNNVYINANTGGNSASMNTGSGTISTGNVNVAANIVNMLNNNFLAGRFVLTIVNVFGSWTGDILPFGSGTAENSVLTDENSSVSISSKNNRLGNAGAYVPNTLSSAGGSGQNGEAEQEEIAANLTKVGGNVKVDSVTKVIGKDSGSITDYWWVLIPLVIAAGSAVYRRRFLWRTQ